MTTLKNFDAQHFLKNFWQQQPIVIKGAFEKTAWITPDELAGLACEDEVESRIIHRKQEQWVIDHGPFEESFFSTLPEDHWTLLVQAVDQWLPEVKAVLKEFNFLPSWRVDDVMVSYAPVGGTVAPHYDYYDVFLIQGEGSRRWQVGQVCDGNSDYDPSAPIKIVNDFVPKMDVILAPGDVLYVPAKHAHYGVSLASSVTYSVGFKAPSIRDIVDGVATEALSYLHDDQRYVDTAKSLQAAAGEIPQSAIDQVTSMLAESLLNKAVIADWLGKSVTEPKYPELTSLEPGFLCDDTDDNVVYKDPASRFAYRVVSAESELCHLFVNGERYNCSVGLAKYLCVANPLELSHLMMFDQSIDKDVLQMFVDVD